MNIHVETMPNLETKLDDYYQILNGDKINLTEGNVFAFAKTLLRDESYAALISAMVTGGTDFALRLFYPELDPLTRSSILGLVGPIAEKPALMWEYGKNVYLEQKSGETDLSLTECVRKVLHDGWPTLRADLLFHDPLYIGMTGTGTHFIGDSSLETGAIATGSFLLAALLAAACEVNLTELNYTGFQKGLRKKGFKSEKYIETRYILHPEDNVHSPDEILADFTKTFDLKLQKAFNYKDLYCDKTSLTRYNDRMPYMRLREMENLISGEVLKSLQIVYTKNVSEKNDVESLINCFPIVKHKFYKRLESGDSIDISKSLNGGTKKIHDRYDKSGIHKEVNFRRHVMHNEDGLYLSVDMPNYDCPTCPYFIELKVREDIDLLKVGNEKLVRSYNVFGTTDSKLGVYHN